MIETPAYLEEKRVPPIKRKEGKRKEKGKRRKKILSLSSLFSP
jgi:hypothetical protein